MAIIVQDFLIELHFNDTMKWNLWYTTQFIDKLCDVFETLKIFLVEKTNTRWQIISKYQIHTVSGIHCTIELIENYEPSYNIYNDDDFVFIQMQFCFSNLEGTIPTLQVDSYNILNDKIKTFYNELIHMSSTFQRNVVTN